MQGRVVVHVDAGRESPDVGEGARAQFFQRIARVGGDGDGHVHHVLGAFLRRDDDLLDDLCLRCGGGEHQAECDGGVAHGSIPSGVGVVAAAYCARGGGSSGSASRVASKTLPAERMPQAK